MYKNFKFHFYFSALFIFILYIIFFMCQVLQKLQSHLESFIWHAYFSSNFRIMVRGASNLTRDWGSKTLYACLKLSRNLLFLRNFLVAFLMRFETRVTQKFSLSLYTCNIMSFRQRNKRSWWPLWCLSLSFSFSLSRPRPRVSLLSPGSPLMVTSANLGELCPIYDNFSNWRRVARELSDANISLSIFSDIIFKK